MKFLLGAVLAACLAAPALAQDATRPLLVAQASATQKPVLAKKLPLSRADMEKALVGRFKEQVVALVGDTTRSAGSSVSVYEGLTFDGTTRKVDSITYVHYDATGKVTRLSY
jgi:opacity protein-like surface antigen